MRNKRIYLPGISMLLATGLILTSCQKAAITKPARVTTSSATAASLTNYGEQRVSHLARKLRHSNRELTHILLIGDSHTAADFLSGQLRTVFQSRYGNGGPGFVSPVAVPGNRYGNVSYGNAQGWCLENSRKSQNDAFTLGGNIATPVATNNQVRISATDGETGLQAQALYRVEGRATLQLQRRSVTLTDTQGRWMLSQALRVPASFSVSLAGEPAQLAGFWLTARQPHGVILSALGNNGAQISMLDKWPADWPGALKMLQPDMVILAYGTNEAFDTSLSPEVYRQDLTRQVEKIRQAVPDAVILLVGPGSSIQHREGIGCQQRQSPVLKTVIKIQQQVAETEHTLFWDWFSFMGGDCAIETWAEQGKARPDLVHLQAEGYKDIANGLWQGLVVVLGLKK